MALKIGKEKDLLEQLHGCSRGLFAKEEKCYG